MRRLWKMAPPLYSDVMGMEAVVNLTQGMAVVDDSDGYKPLRLRISDDLDPREPRVIDSRIRTIDIVTGTENRICEAFAEAKGDFGPDFVLLAHAPSSTMISSDLDATAERIAAESDLPAGVVAIDGSKDYLHGMSATFEAMANLLLVPQETRARSVNILGANAIDWTLADLEALEAALTARGWEVLSRWGMRETTERLRSASAASMNLVVSIAGLKLAQLMEREYGIPYVAAAPFGATQATWVLGALEGIETSVASAPSQEGEPTTLIVGEQLMANALRAALAERGIGPARVLSFTEMDRRIMAPGDAKLAGEDDLAAQLAAPSVSLVLADPDLAPIANRDLAWIALPNVASQFPIVKSPLTNRFGTALHEWLDAQLEAINA